MNTHHFHRGPPQEIECPSLAGHANNTGRTISAGLLQPTRPTRPELAVRVATSVQSALSEREQRLQELGVLCDRVMQFSRALKARLYVEPLSAAPVAQMIGIIHGRLGSRGVVYCGSTARASELARLFCRTGLRAAGPEQLISKGATRASVLLLSSGMHFLRRFGRIQYALHMSPSVTMAQYIADIKATGLDGRWLESVLLFAKEATSGCVDMRLYCTTWRCRYAQLLRMLVPASIVPQPYEFSCRCCDVCISEPRGHTDDFVYRETACRVG